MSVLLLAVLSRYQAASGSRELAAWGLWLCDGEPCFMGIVPGVTTQKEIAATLKRLEALHLLKDLDEANSQYGYTASGTIWNMYVSISATSDGRVNFIDLISLRSDSNLGITVRDLLQVLGSSCAVGFFIDEFHPRLLYPTMMIDVTLEASHMTESTTFANYILMTPKEMAEALRCSSTETLPVVKWESFSTLRRNPSKN